VIATELPLPSPYGWEGERRAVEGVPLDDVAERFGTPVYVTSETRIRERARAVRGAFAARWPRYRLLYALKANPNPALVRILQNESCGADCSSPAEIRIAREAGIPAEHCLYTAAYPSDRDLSAALAAGVGINLDDPALLPRLLRLGAPTTLSFRVNPGRTAAGPEGLRFAGHRSKFGTPLERLRPAYADAHRAGIPQLGIHTMPGSNVLEAGHFRRVGEFLGAAVRTIRSAIGDSLDFVDAGGGFGVPYRPEESGLAPGSIARSLTSGLRRGLRGAADGFPPTLLNEPGRFLVADSTVLLTRVTHVKDGPTPWVGVDAGMHTLLRPALYGAYHGIYSVRRPRGRTRRVTVVGPVCENTDVLAARRALPELRVGDLLAIGNAGAYGFSMSSQYNTRPRPAEVLVTNGRANLMRAAETFDDLVRRTELPEHLIGATPVGRAG
jgi:diaminopimelate decarboxylase